jgi:hypothetical protein
VSWSLVLDLDDGDWEAVGGMHEDIRTVWHMVFSIATIMSADASG